MIVNVVFPAWTLVPWGLSPVTHVRYIWVNDMCGLCWLILSLRKLSFCSIVRLLLSSCSWCLSSPGLRLSLHLMVKDWVHACKALGASPEPELQVLNIGIHPRWYSGFVQEPAIETSSPSCFFSIMSSYGIFANLFYSELRFLQFPLKMSSHSCLHRTALGTRCCLQSILASNKECAHPDSGKQTAETLLQVENLHFSGNQRSEKVKKNLACQIKVFEFR